MRAYEPAWACGRGGGAAVAQSFGGLDGAGIEMGE